MSKICLITLKNRQLQQYETLLNARTWGTRIGGDIIPEVPSVQVTLMQMTPYTKYSPWSDFQCLCPCSFQADIALLSQTSHSSLFKSSALNKQNSIKPANIKSLSSWYCLILNQHDFFSLTPNNHQPDHRTRFSPASHHEGHKSVFIFSLPSWQKLLLICHLLSFRIRVHTATVCTDSWAGNLET